MLDLQEMRKEIDVIDDQIVKLFEKRMSIAEDVAKFKIETQKPVFDRTREQEKLETLGQKTHSAFNCCGVQELYQHIMSISRKRQYQLLQESAPPGNRRIPCCGDSAKGQGFCSFPGSGRCLQPRCHACFFWGKHSKLSCGYLEGRHGGNQKGECFLCRASH